MKSAGSSAGYSVWSFSTFPDISICLSIFFFSIKNNLVFPHIFFFYFRFFNLIDFQCIEAIIYLYIKCCRLTICHDINCLSNIQKIYLVTLLRLPPHCFVHTVVKFSHEFKKKKKCQVTCKLNYRF